MNRSDHQEKEELGRKGVESALEPLLAWGGLSRRNTRSASLCLVWVEANSKIAYQV